MKKNPTIVPVVAVALIDEAGRVLMQQRKLGSEHGGLWEFPGGKVEAGESLEESLCREICEELGLILTPAALAPLTFATTPGQPYVIMLYTCHDWSGEPQCLEGEAIRWIALDEAAALPMPPLDIPLAQTLRDRFGSPI